MCPLPHDAASEKDCVKIPVPRLFQGRDTQEDSKHPFPLLTEHQRMADGVQLGAVWEGGGPFAYCILFVLVPTNSAACCTPIEVELHKETCFWTERTHCKEELAANVRTIFCCDITQFSLEREKNWKLKLFLCIFQAWMQFLRLPLMGSSKALYSSPRAGSGAHRDLFPEWTEVNEWRCHLEHQLSRSTRELLFHSADCPQSVLWLTASGFSCPSMLCAQISRLIPPARAQSSGFQSSFSIDFSTHWFWYPLDVPEWRPSG